MKIKTLLLFIFVTFFSLPSFALDLLKKEPKAEEKKVVTLEEIDPDRFTENAVLQGLNKVTAKSSKLEVKVGEEIIFGQLRIKVEKCIKSHPEERPENKILMQISEISIEGQLAEKGLFHGWMFSSTPSISSLEHPIYDVTAIECKN